MKKTQTLKLNKEFRRLYYRGKSIASGNIVVYALYNGRNTRRLGLTCGKTIGKAVYRNRVKRIMRESYRLLEDRIKPGCDIVIVARSKSVYAKCQKISKELESSLSRLGLLKDD